MPLTPSREPLPGDLVVVDDDYGILRSFSADCSSVDVDMGNGFRMTVDLEDCEPELMTSGAPVSFVELLRGAKFDSIKLDEAAMKIWEALDKIKACVKSAKLDPQHPMSSECGPMLVEAMQLMKEAGVRVPDVEVST